MAKMPATVHPYVAAEPANSAIEGGDSSEIEKYIQLCAECERIAIQIHPSYKEQYENVSAMMSTPPAIVNIPIASQYLSMTPEKETFKAMQAKLEGQSTKDWSASAINPSCLDPPFETPPMNHRKQSTRGASPDEAETRPRKIKKEEATEHSWPINERLLTTALEKMDLEQLKQAVSATMQDVSTLSITLSE